LPQPVCPHHGQVPGVIFQFFLLFVGGLVFLIHNDDSKALKRGKDGGSARWRWRRPLLDFSPLVKTLPFPVRCEAGQVFPNRS